MGERVVVVEVVAGDEPLDPVAGDREAVRAGAADVEAAFRRWAGRRGARRADRDRLRVDAASAGTDRMPSPAAGSSAAAASRARGRPWWVAEEVTSTGTSTPSRSTPSIGGVRGEGGLDEIAFRQREHARQRGQTRVVGGELVLDGRVVGDGVGAVERPQIEHMHEQPRALDVREEVMPEPGAGARTLDQSGNVGDHELAVILVERAEHRLERRERVVGDLRRRPRQPRQQRGLAGVGKTDQPDVSEQLQLQRQPALLARRGRARRTAASGGSGPTKRRLPRPPEPPPCDERALARGDRS